ncbi:MAG: hypothetical protein MI794_05900 [Pseudomonadales bacterium]|nr:hypothetical protein [Pseudomonadales bacterium]
MKISVTEWRIVDEQKGLVVLAAPVVTKEKFAEQTGLTVGQVRGMIEKGHLPSLKVGNAKVRFVNVAALTQEALSQEDWG